MADKTGVEVAMSYPWSNVIEVTDNNCSGSPAAMAADTTSVGHAAGAFVPCKTAASIKAPKASPM